MGKEWARHNYTAHSLDIALPGYEDQYLNRLQSEFHVSTLNPPRNDFKRTRFDNNISGGQQQPGSSNPQQPMTNSQYAEQRRNKKQGNNETLASLIAAVVSKFNTDSFLLGFPLISQVASSSEPGDIPIPAILLAITWLWEMSY